MGGIPNAAQSEAVTHQPAPGGPARHQPRLPLSPGAGIGGGSHRHRYHGPATTNTNNTMKTTTSPPKIPRVPLLGAAVKATTRKKVTTQKPNPQKT